MIEEDKIVQEAKKSTEDNGIVFLDEIDKVSANPFGIKNTTNVKAHL